MGWPVWWAVVFALALLLDGILIADAAYQILRERPGFLPFDRMLRKRVPATPQDCLLQGAGKLLASVGILIVQVPMFLISILIASGWWQGDLFGRKAISLVLMASAVLTLFLVVSAARVQSKVRYTYLGSTVNEP